MLRSSSGRSPPRARMAALSWASSGSSRLEQAESLSEFLAFRVGLAAVGRAGGFFKASLRKDTDGRQTQLIKHTLMVSRVKVYPW